jgi:hypothetical protein
MNRNVRHYFMKTGEGSAEGKFHQVFSLQEHEMSWEELSKRIPVLSRGWYELSQLEVSARVEFTRDFWLAKLPFVPDFPDFLGEFFARLDDVGVYLIQPSMEAEWEAQMVYSLADNSGFYHGSPPAMEAHIDHLHKGFSEYRFPEDYLAFLQIHDGFGKYTDTGIIESSYLPEMYNRLQEYLEGQDPVQMSDGSFLDPRALIPFYESFGLNCYQCFYGAWYPDQEIGNVYFSGIENTLSETGDPESWEDNMAFPTFLDWLKFYLEEIG